VVDAAWRWSRAVKSLHRAPDEELTFLNKPTPDLLAAILAPLFGGFLI
jgi:hypothetical protein